MTRACFSRSAWAWRDMASCRATGMATSRISTEITDNAPSGGLVTNLVPQVLVSCLPVGQECREHGGADHLSQRGLRDAVDGLPVVGDFQRRLARVMDVPKNNRVDVDRHGIFGQCLLGIEGGGLYAFVDDCRHIVDDREDHEETWPFHTLELAGSEDNELLPSVGHLERERDDHRSDKEGWSQEHVDRLAKGETYKSAGNHQEQSNRVHARCSSRAVVSCKLASLIPNRRRVICSIQLSISRASSTTDTLSIISATEVIPRFMGIRLLPLSGSLRRLTDRDGEGAQHVVPSPQITPRSRLSSTCAIARLEGGPLSKAAELFCTGSSNCRIRCIASGHGSPAALLDDRSPVP